MKTQSLLRFAAIPAACLLVATGFVIVRASASSSQSASDTDKKFVNEALKGGMAEVSLGQLAAQKGASEDVKAFGQKMVTDHSRLGDRMKVVAGDIGVSQPDSATLGDTAEKAKLSMLSGNAFDEAYIKAMVKDHQDDLKAFQQEEAEGTSPEVKHAAREGVAMIQSHLTMIQKIAAAHNIGNSASYRKPSPYGNLARGR
jgi:putative membrane protein